MSLFEGINRADINEHELGVSSEFKRDSTALQIPKKTFLFKLSRVLYL